MTYFPDFGVRPELDPALDGTAAAPKPKDAGGDALPFGHLSDRRFEVLAYRIKSAGSSPGVATLMQGTGERGRDVVVYSAEGQLSEIVQCKLLQEKMTLPAARAELVKLALHHYLDPTILGGAQILYELWAPGGFTEPAARLLDTWPQEWQDAEIESTAAEVKAKYTALKNIDWARARQCLLEDFAGRVRIKKRTAIDITSLVRANLPIYEAFFEGQVVMSRDQVGDYLREILEGGNLRQINTADARHVLERLEAIPEARRFNFGIGYMLGLSAPLIVAMTSAERTRIGAGLLGSVTEVVHVVMAVGQRRVSEMVDKLKQLGVLDHPALTWIATELLINNLVARIDSLIVPGLKLQPELGAYAALSVDEQLERHIERFNVEFAPRPAVLSTINASLVQNSNQLRRAVEDLLAFLPKEVVTFCDTRTAFEDEFLMSRLAESMAQLDDLKRETEEKSGQKGVAEGDGRGSLP